MKKILTPILVSLFLLITLSGCNEKIVKVYVDENGTEINKPKLGTMNADIVCDDRGYAYYSSKYYAAFAPVLENHGYGSYIVECKDL